MESQAVVLVALVLLAFHGGLTDGACTTCPQLTLSTGLYFIDAPVTYAPKENIAVACSLGYVATGGSSSGTCSGSQCSWTWGTTSGAILQCTRGCLAPSLTQGVEYVSGGSSTSYLSGTTVSLKCSTNYGLKVGSTTGTCNGTTFTWTWAAGEQLECDPVCPAPTLTTGLEFASGSSLEYTLGDVITLRCSSGYVSTNGGVLGTCASSNTWQWNGTGMLQCTRGCAAPNVTPGVEYLSGDAKTAYAKGSTVSLKCGAQYGYKIGSYNGTCSNTYSWTWSTGRQLECEPVCLLPTLPSGVQFVSSTTATYNIGSTISVSCILDYGYFSGSYSATCGINSIWDWTLLGQLQCHPTCLPLDAGINATISPSFSKAIYLLNETIQYECVSGYVPLSGSSSGVCSSVNQWTWQDGTAASLSCVIAPPYKDRISDTFKPATCESYVIRSTPTSATCLISCLNDGYCRGYAFDGAVCYLDRPFIEAAAGSLMPCFARQYSQI